MTTKKYFINNFSLAAGLLVACVSAQAFAQGGPFYCTPIAVNADPTGALTVCCSYNGGCRYWWAWPNDSANNTPDTIRIYLSMIQSALLSGKTVGLVGGYDYIISTIYLYQ